MIDLLVKYPDRETGIGFGRALGFLEPDSDEVPVLTPQGVNICEIGIHSHNIGTEDEPSMVEVPGWWVMLRADDGFPVPTQIYDFVVEPNPENPAIPARVWL